MKRASPIGLMGTETESHFLDEKKKDLISRLGGHASKGRLEQYLEKHWDRYAAFLSVFISNVPANSGDGA